MVSKLDEKILFKRARTSQSPIYKSNPYTPKSADSQKQVDKKGVLVIDPNKVINQYGEIVDRYVKQEDLTIYASLKVVKNAETAVVSHSGGGVDENGNTIQPTISSKTVSEPIYVNFLNPLRNKRRTTDNTFDRKGKLTTEWVDFFTSDDANNKEKSSYVIDSETFGLQDISIAMNASYLPIIKITFTDVQGRMLFERGNDPDSPYNIFFTYPYPKFYLTYKGYYGRAVEMPLYLLKSNTRFDPQTGDYQTTAEFQSEMFGLFTTFLIIYAYAAPYMFMSDDGEYLGYKILKRLYEKQNAEIEQNLRARGINDPKTLNQYKIDSNKAPTLLDLGEAIKKIPLKAFDIDNNENTLNLDKLLKAKRFIETERKTLVDYFNDQLNYRTIPNSGDQVLYYANNNDNVLISQSARPVVIYNSIAELSARIEDVISVDTYATNNSNSESVITKLRNFIKDDVTIKNQQYKQSVANNGNIITDQMLFGTVESINGTKQQTYLVYVFDRVINELLNQISLLQVTLENNLVENEIAEIGTYLGYEPNLNNILRILANNMQTFLILMELMSKNALKQIQSDPKRRRIHESKTNYINDPGLKTKQYSSFPNYYKTVKTTLTDGSIADKFILSYPGIDNTNQNWFEVLFVEEIYKALKFINDRSSNKPIDTLNKKFSSILNVFGLGDIDLDVYKNKQTPTKLISEAISKYLLYLNYSGVIHRGLSVNDIEKLSSLLATHELSIMNKTIFNSPDDFTSIKKGVYDFTKKDDKFVDSGAVGIKNTKSNNQFIKYTNLGNFGINGVNVVSNGGSDLSTITGSETDFGTISIYPKIVEFVNTESELYSKKYTESELTTVNDNRNAYINKSIQNVELYNAISFTTNKDPLKYSLSLANGKTEQLSVYPDLRSSTLYFSDINPNIILNNPPNTSFDLNNFQGFFKNLNEKLSSDAKINIDTTKNVALGKSIVPALTQSTKIEEHGDAFVVINKPSTSYYKAFREL